MISRKSLFLTAAASFATGFVTGVLVTPQSGKDVRRRIASTASDSSRWVGDQLSGMEMRIGELEQQLHHLSHQFGDQMRQATHGAVDYYVPSFERGEDWDIDPDEMARELRGLPRK